MRFSLRTLIIVMLLGGPLCAWGWLEWKARQNAAVALDGYCPVTLADYREWGKGKPEFRADFEGISYRFVGAHEQQAFRASPTTYAVAFQGNDVVRMVDEQRLSPGSRRHGIRYLERTYVFDSEETLVKFEAAPAKYLGATNASAVTSSVIVLPKWLSYREVLQYAMLLTIGIAFGWWIRGRWQRGDPNPLVEQLTSVESKPMSRLSFSLRDVFWLTLVVAIGLGWWLEHMRLASYREIWAHHFGETPVRDNAFQQPWNRLDLRLHPVPKDEFAALGSKYKGGLRVTAVRPGSQAAEQGIRAGDILVGLHVWTTASLENVEYVLDRKDLESFQPLKVYLLRDKEIFFGEIRLANSDRSEAPVLPDNIPAAPDGEQ